jgi:S1-C subfamily serine protease
MPIVITALDGPLEGRRFEFGADKTLITIGRFDDRDIRFPASFDRVSRAHAAIAFENGRYVVRPETAVFADGEELFRDDVLPRACVLALGAPDGPKLGVSWTVPDTMPETALPAGARRVGAERRAAAAAASARTGSRRAMGVALAALAAVAVAVGAWFATRDPPIEAVLDRARPSVYLVVIRDAQGRERGRGTASVIAPGTLATNAHVADGFDERPRGEVWVVRSNVPPHDSIEIKSVALHPHYAAFEKATSAFGPTYGNRYISLIPGYDVALIRVDPAAKLAPPLKLAPPERLRGLTPAETVALIGYPMESMAAGGTDLRAPLPVTQVARLVNVTDYFMLSDRREELLLLQHAIPTRGGASGSPIFNAKGEVVGYHNAGNSVWVKTASGGTARVASGAMVNFGQRADLVAELLENRAAALTGARERFWSERLARFKSYAEARLDSFVRLSGIDKAVPVLERELVIETAPGDVQPRARVDYATPGPGKILIALSGDRDAKLTLVLRGPDGKEAARDGGGAYADFMADTRAALRLSIVAEAPPPGAKAMLRVYFAPFGL